MADRPDPVVELVPVSSDNWAALARLDIAPDQYRYLEAHMGMYLLAKSYAHPRLNLWAISTAGQIVGALHEETDGDLCTLHAMFIDQAHQNRGLGRAVLTRFLSDLPTRHPQIRKVRLSIVPGNHAAHRLVTPLGFLPTGHQDDLGNPRLELTLPLRTPTP